ncbi:hypothetical protein EJB05_45562, partial [Eragrostis curvula]
MEASPEPMTTFKLTAMKTEPMAAVPVAKKRRTETHEGRGLATSLLLASEEPLSLTDASGPTSEPKLAHNQERKEEDYVDLLPDGVVEDIISRLPTKDAVRTRTLAPRWNLLWPSAPLNLDSSGGGLPEEEQVQAGLISRILAAHRGPARRFSVPALHLQRRLATVDNWLNSAALDNLQELEFYVMYNFGQAPAVLLPASAFRFSATLRVVTISECHISNGAVEGLSFPQLRHLGLQGVIISEGSLQSIIDGSPVLECLLLYCSSGFHSIRINSSSLVSIGLYNHLQPVTVIVEDAPLLERLLQLQDYRGMHVSVISAPRLETLGRLSDCGFETKYTFGAAILIQDLGVISFTTAVQTVKNLAISMGRLSLDTVINLMRCFPCLEKLYIQTSCVSGGQNLWRRKHKHLVRSHEIRLKTVVLKNYRGIKSQVSFATFFVLNAKMLELMRFEGRKCNDSQFIAKQRNLLELAKRASKGAQFQFTKSRICIPHIRHVSDLSKTDPFECGVCPFNPSA